jgi:IS605 OrfB family transposase
MPHLFTKTLRLKIRHEAYPWLNAAAIEVNQVFNFCNETSFKASIRTDKNRKWMSGFDLCNLTAGATEFFNRIGADTIQSICTHYEQKRSAAKKLNAKKLKLRWRKSGGWNRSLGWIPFKALSLKRKGKYLRFAGKTFRVFESSRLDGVKWKAGCFAQDSVRDWWLCLPIEVQVELAIASYESVGIDLGLKSIATTSDRDVLEAGKWTHNSADKLANAQRRGHKKQTARIHRKIKRQRADALHKFSRKIVNQYQKIVIGDVSSPKLVKTRMAKSVLDSGWGMFRQMLQYKGENAGRSVEVINEKNTSIACSSCGSLTGPHGMDGLIVRQWDCSDCGESHDRDVNAARNILRRAEESASVCGNELSYLRSSPSSAFCAREAGTMIVKVAA